MTKGLTPIKRPALPGFVRDSIKEYIRQNGLRPGSQIPSEKELSQRLGVGRNSVREAVKALESVGVLETRQGSGIYVRDFTIDPLLDELQDQFLCDVQEIGDFLEVRKVLELGMIDETLRLIGKEQIARLERILARMRACAERREAFMEEDREFHRLLFEPVQNAILLKLLDVFWLVYCRATEELEDDDSRMRIYQDHEVVLTAVRQRNTPAARRAIQLHYAFAQDRLAKGSTRQNAGHVPAPAG